MSKYQLPPRKWYTLEQAIKRIKQLTGEELEIEDLLHFWKIRKIEICAFCLMSPEEIKIGNLDIQDSGFSFVIYYDYTEEEDFRYVQDDILELLKLSKFKFKMNDMYYVEREAENEISKITELVTHKEFYTQKPITLDESYEGIFYINGFLSIIQDKTVDLSNNLAFNYNKITFATPKCNQSNDSRIIIEIVNLDHNYELSPENLYILNSDLEDFLNNKAEPPNKVSNNKTINTQAEFIRNLISVTYGEDVANNIRKHLDNPQSEISRDFETKGLTAPSGKTVDKWING
ncbi:hypothetical protein RO21_11295 [[Actinobacillus] muris]|uniref:Uncharacterized protein n=1 Tax=Muribacter muris TaxID=67855 RepID=A0A0J5P1W0_9PAST|nr:hypothetical protein [Muribacter muris]KMK50518.1 hypothetical protein RO21_11295 [[Actinobacillus] muris] [Muribacter muris]